jgi:signal transduction histidine kinase
MVRVGDRMVPSEQVSAAVGAAAREEVLRAGLIAFPLVVIAAALVSWWLVGRVLGPLHAVTATARRLSVESLDTRTGVRDARGEVAELAAGFDAMLDRLQAAFEAQRRFVANASHELRTPLSVIRAELDVTLADPNADEAELRRMAEVVRAATLRAGQLVEALLVLASADGQGIGVAEPVDLATAVGSAWRAVAGDAQARHISASFVGDSAPTVGDPALIERVAGNLLENAVRHNVDGGWIEVLVERDSGTSCLRVRSSGAQVDPDRVAELFEPFRRGGVDRTARAGTGLGLSIVRAVVLAHHGQVSADAVPGGGLSVTVRLPQMS